MMQDDDDDATARLHIMSWPLGQIGQKQSKFTLLNYAIPAGRTCNVCDHNSCPVVLQCHDNPTQISILSRNQLITFMSHC